MARYRDSSSSCHCWTNAKLMREAKRLANLESFSVGWNDIPAEFKIGWHEQVNPNSPRVDDFILAQTKLYRETWLAPILNEIERRFVKTK